MSEENGHDILRVEPAIGPKGKKFWSRIRQELIGWEDLAIKIDPPESYDNRTTVVKKSYDAPPKSVSELVERLKAEGASDQLIMHTVLLWAEKSYDNRTTIVRPSAYEAKKAYDREYRKKRRAAEKMAEKVVRQNDTSKAEYISSLPLEDSQQEDKRDSGIRAREAFERFWRVYPKRQGGNPRKPAEDQFLIALKNGHDPEKIIAGAEAYALACKRSNMVGTAYVAHARTWLRQQRWNDDYSDHGGGNVRPGSGVSNPHRQGGGKSNGIREALGRLRDGFAGDLGDGDEVCGTPARMLPGRGREQS